MIIKVSFLLLIMDGLHEEFVQSFKIINGASNEYFGGHGILSASDLGRPIGN